MKQTNRTLSILLAILMLFSVATTAMAAGGNGGGGNPLTLVSAKVGEADLEGAKIPAGSVITVTFSNNVTDATVLSGNIGKIKVKNAAGEVADASVAPGDSNTVFLVTLGNVSKGDYTLTIDQGVTAKNGNSLESNVEFAFKVNQGTGTGTGGGGGNNPLNLVSAKADGKDLKDAELAATGTITITFNRGMTENQETNFAQIGIYDKDGKKADGVTFSDFTKDDDGNSYTVLSYKDLAGGAYTLKLGKDLKANNGNTLGEDVTISFTVKGGNNDKSDFVRNILDTVVNFFKMIINFFKDLFNK